LAESFQCGRKRQRVMLPFMTIATMPKMRLILPEKPGELFALDHDPCRVDIRTTG
jgi:hypothetical protein